MRRVRPDSCRTSVDGGGSMSSGDSQVMLEDSKDLEFYFGFAYLAVGEAQAMPGVLTEPKEQM